MAIIETKYSVGDKVFTAGCDYKTVTEVCPDCKGSGKWTVLFADGKTEPCPCQTCSRGYLGSTGVITHHEWQPSVVEVTIGLVTFDQDGPQYMCKETGIGSGTLYNETNIFDNIEDAERHAQDRYELTMKNIAENNFKKKNSFADRLSTYGYSRHAALEAQRSMNTWIKLISKKNEASK